ncbi:MAG: carbon-nitrogen hydrolase family protein [Myxococcota bacterium]
MKDRITVAIVQTTPAFDDLAACLALLEERTRDAAAQGAELVTLGETFLPGYPAWLDTSPGAAFWDHEPVKDVYANLRRNSVVVGGAETEWMGRLVRELGITLVVGVHERVEQGPGSHTLYNALLTFTPDGALANHHRKLVPTYTERLVWGPGDGEGLRSVDADGVRVSSLVCWEHWMPLARQALHEAGEQVHVAVWPTVHDRHQLASRHYAFEGRCFVLAAGQLGRVCDMPAALQPAGADPDELLLRGGSCIYGPDGSVVVEPRFDEDATIVAELDLTRIDAEAMTLDVTGHYHRPDVFEFGVRGLSARASATTDGRAAPGGPPGSRRDP